MVTDDYDGWIMNYLLSLMVIFMDGDELWFMVTDDSWWFSWNMIYKSR